MLQDTVPLNLDALRVSIAPQESDCAKAVTSASAAAALRRNGCEAVLRATYVDATRSYVMTVGVAVLPNAAAATSADSGTDHAAAGRGAAGQRAGPAAAGVLVVRFRGAGARRYDYNRQISDSFTAGPYLVMYAAGYSDSRPRVPVTQDAYSDAEMTSMAGVVSRPPSRAPSPPAPARRTAPERPDAERASPCSPRPAWSRWPRCPPPRPWARRRPPPTASGPTSSGC